MKRTTIFFYLTMIAALATSADALAQRGMQFSINQNTSVPLGADFKDYVSKTSFRGVQVSLMYGITEDIRAGLQVGYNDFYERYPRQLYKTADGSDISAVLTNTIQVMPVLAKGTYSLKNTGFARPYVGLGAGVNLISYGQYLGEFKTGEQYLKPAISADAGVLFPISKDSRYGLRIGTSYNFQPFNKQGIKNLNTWNVQAGFFVPLR